jgi:hypothetical protein
MLNPDMGLLILSLRSKTAKEHCFGGDPGCACHSGLTARVRPQSLLPCRFAPKPLKRVASAVILGALVTAD